MAVSALLFAIVTVLVGVVALGDVVMGDAGAGLKRLAVAHVGLAATGVILLLVAVVGVSRGTAWASLIALLVAAAMGLTTLALTRRQAPAGATPKRGVALPVVIAHGAAALVTIGTVLAAAAGNGLVRH